jgi:hypothetical protein
MKKNERKKEWKLHAHECRVCENVMTMVSGVYQLPDSRSGKQRFRAAMLCDSCRKVYVRSFPVVFE